MSVAQFICAFTSTDLADRSSSWTNPGNASANAGGVNSFDPTTFADSASLVAGSTNTLRYYIPPLGFAILANKTLNGTTFTISLKIYTGGTTLLDTVFYAISRLGISSSTAIVATTSGGAALSLTFNISSTTQATAAALHDEIMQNGLTIDIYATGVGAAHVVHSGVLAASFNTDAVVDPNEPLTVASGGLVTPLVSYTRRTLAKNKHGGIREMVTGWAAQFGNGRQDSTGVLDDTLVPEGGASATPMIRAEGGEHASFGIINPNSSARLQKAYGTLIDPGNCVFYGVIRNNKGRNALTTPFCFWNHCADGLYMEAGDFSNDGLQIRIGGTGGAVLLPEILPAGKTGFVLRMSQNTGRCNLSLTTGSSYDLIASGLAAPSTSNTGGLAKILTVGSNSGGTHRLFGGIDSIGAADDTGNSFATPLIGTLLGQIQTAEQIPLAANVDTLILVLGDSEGAGTAMDMGGSMGEFIANRYASRAWVKVLAVGGRTTAQVLAEQIPLITSATVTLGKTFRNKFLLVKTGKNDVLQGLTNTTEFQQIANAGQAAGFTVIFGDITPAASNGNDAAVALFESNRAAQRALIAACSGCTKLATASRPEFKPLPASGSAADVAAAVHLVTRSALYEQPKQVMGNQDLNSRGSGDEIHLGDAGWGVEILDWIGAVDGKLALADANATGSEEVSGRLNRIGRGM